MLDFVKSNQIPFLFALISVVFYLSFGYDLERSNFIKLSLLYAALFFLAYKIIQISKNKFWLLAGFGLVFRLLFIVSVPNLSQDFYRFLWDGRVLLQGLNPYLFTPDMYMENSGLYFDKLGNTVYQATELYKGMGALNASHYSNYPPFNQLFFAIAAFFSGKSMLGSVVILRLFMILADVGILYFGSKLLKKLGRNPHNIFWYFLNPFIIIELTGNLHFEGVMLFFLIWALYLLHQKKWYWAAMLIGISISTKLIPLLFLPLCYRYFVRDGLFEKGFWQLKKFSWVIISVVLLAFAPFLSAQFIENFSATLGLWFQEFEFNASIHYLIRWVGFKTYGWNLIETTSKILPGLVLLFVLMLSFFRKNTSLEQLITSMLFAISFYLLLSTTVHPWYIATPVLLSIFTTYKFPLVWSLMVMLSYSAYGAIDFQENLWLVAIEYILVIGMAVWEFFISKRSNLSPKVRESVMP
jgi:hypothetical protein